MKAQDFISGVKAGYGFFHIETYEMERCLRNLAEMIEGAKETMPMEVEVWDFEQSPDPDAALEKIDASGPWTVHILKNFDWFLRMQPSNQLNYAAIQMLQNRESVYCSGETRKIVVIVSDTPFSNAIPKTLEKQFMSLEFGLPEADEIAKTVEFIIKSAQENPNFKLPDEDKKKDIVDAVKGLTVAEVKAALAFSLVKHKGEFNVSTLIQIRNKGLEKVAGIKAIDTSKIDPEKMKGLENLKRFVLKAIMGKMAHLMKGIMLLGPPGTGKTTFFMWLSRVTGLPLYMVEVAELFGGLMGESERLMRDFINVLWMLAPGIVVFDEIEKALAGTKSGNTGDGGTTKRSTAQLLKFMSGERPERLYIFATCNDITGLPPEWVRPGRWDASAFFIDLPTDEEKEEILKYYQGVYSVKGAPKSMEGWSGAEIEAVCRIAALLESKVNEVEDYICPVSKTMGDEIDALRKWAKGRTIPASKKILKNGGNGKRAINF